MTDDFDKTTIRADPTTLEPDAGRRTGRVRPPARSGAPRRRPAAAGPSGAVGAGRPSWSSPSASRVSACSRCRAAESPPCLGLRARKTAIMYGEVRLDLPGDQRARRRLVPVQVPGLRRPGRARDEARRDPRPTRRRGQRRQADLHAPTSSRGSAASSLSASARCRTRRRDLERPASPRTARVPSPWSPSRTQRSPRPGSTGSSRRVGDADRHGDLQRRDADHFTAPTNAAAAFATVDGKVAIAGDVVSVKAAIDTGGNGGFADQAEPKAALDATTGDHVGFVYIALRPLLDWSSQLAECRTMARRDPERRVARHRSRTGRRSRSASKATLRDGGDRAARRRTARRRRDRTVNGRGPRSRQRHRAVGQPRLRRACSSTPRDLYRSEPDARRGRRGDRPGARLPRRARCGRRLDRRPRGRRRPTRTIRSKAA